MSEDLRHSIVALLPRLRSFARALTRRTDDADDLVQQTCEKALRSLSSFQPDTRLDSWLFRIMRNTFIDGYRRDRHTVSIEDTTVAETAISEDGRVVADARIALSKVEAAIALLPEEQRTVLVLVCVEGMRYREVADILGAPIGTVMSRLARAREAVAKAMESNIVPFPRPNQAKEQ